MNAKEVAMERVKRELVWINKQLAIAESTDCRACEIEVEHWTRIADACSTILAYWSTPREMYEF